MDDVALALELRALLVEHAPEHLSRRLSVLDLASTQLFLGAPFRLESRLGLLAQLLELLPLRVGATQRTRELLGHAVRRHAHLVKRGREHCIALLELIALLQHIRHGRVVARVLAGVLGHLGRLAPH